MRLCSPTKLIPCVEGHLLMVATGRVENISLFMRLNLCFGHFHFSYSASMLSRRSGANVAKRDTCSIEFNSNMQNTNESNAEAYKYASPICLF